MRPLLLYKTFYKGTLFYSGPLYKDESLEIYYPNELLKLNDVDLKQNDFILSQLLLREEHFNGFVMDYFVGIKMTVKWNAFKNNHHILTYWAEFPLQYEAPSRLISQMCREALTYIINARQPVVKLYLNCAILAASASTKVNIYSSQNQSCWIGKVRRKKKEMVRFFQLFNVSNFAIVKWSREGFL